MKPSPSMPSDRGPLPAGWPMAAAVVLFLCWAGAFIWMTTIPLHSGGRTFCLFDDAMISMRYADNLAQGHGPVWNPGERVEGYTNPLMVGVMALLLLVAPNPVAVLWVQILGSLLVVATALLAIRVYHCLAARDRRFPTWLLLLFVGGIYTLSYWALMGMETGLVAFFLALGVHAVVVQTEGEPGRPARNRSLILGLSGAGLYLSRPDAVAFVVPLLAYQYMIPRRKAIRSMLAPVLIIALVIIAHVLFRFAYYGTLWPNTALLKLGQFPLQYRLPGGMRYAMMFLQGAAALLTLAGLSFLIKRDALRVLLLSLFAVAVGYQIYVGGDSWLYWRIMTPTMPLLLILAADGAFRLSTIVLGRWNWPLLHHAVTALLLLGAIYLYDRPFLRQLCLVDSPFTVDANILNVNTAHAITDLTRDTASVGLFWAGSIPFYSQRYGVDFLGKSDPDIAGRAPDLSGAVGWKEIISIPGHNKYDLNISIVDRRPTYIQGTTWGTNNVSGWASRNYVSITHGGVPLLLLKNSPDVLWQKVEQQGGNPGAENSR